MSKAEVLVSKLLEMQLPNRFNHAMGVAKYATEALPGYLRNEGVVLLETSGVLHDIGYSPEIAETGFHPLDGARFLRAEGWDEAVVNLVANHSCATVEADLRGLGEELRREFPKDLSLPHDELCFCDLSIGPTGQPMRIDERLSDIRGRYGPDSIVGNFLDLAESDLRASVERVQAKIDSA